MSGRMGFLLVEVIIKNVPHGTIGGKNKMNMYMEIGHKITEKFICKDDLGRDVINKYKTPIMAEIKDNCFVFDKAINFTQNDSMSVDISPLIDRAYKS